MQIGAHTDTHARAHTHARTHAHTHTHTHTHTRTHTHKHAQTHTQGTDTKRVRYLAVGASKMPPAHKGVHEFTAPTMVHSTLTRNVLHGAGGSRGHPFIIAPANEYKATKSLLNKSWVACYFQSFQLLVSAYEGLRQQYLAIYGHHSDVAQVVASIVGLHSL